MHPLSTIQKAQLVGHRNGHKSTRSLLQNYWKTFPHKRLGDLRLRILQPCPDQDPLIDLLPSLRQLTYPHCGLDPLKRMEFSENLSIQKENGCYSTSQNLRQPVFDWAFGSPGQS